MMMSPLAALCDIHQYILSNLLYNLTSYLFFNFQALNGFLMILTCEGEVFFATHSIESYLGFHQVSFFLFSSKFTNTRI